MSSVAKKGWNLYIFQLQHHPLRTKAITAGVLSGISDSVAQKLSGIQRLQLRRLVLKVLFGVVYLGPFGHFLHKLLDAIFKGKRDSKTVAKKVKSKIAKEYPSVQMTSWMFWPVVGWVNHRYMPLQFRVIFHSLVAFCWGLFLNLRAKSMTLIKQ